MTKKRISKSKDNSPHIPQSKKIKNKLLIKDNVKLTEKQAELIKQIKDKQTKLIFVSGPAGTAKTFTAILGGLHLLNDKRVSELIYVRSVVESSDNKIGFLPGEVDDKLKQITLKCLSKKK